METNKNMLLRVGSILMAVCALVAILVSAVNIFLSLGSIGNMSASEWAMLEDQFSQLGVSAEQAMGIFSTISYIALVLVVIFNVMKIIVGIVGFRKAETASTYFIAWGIVLLIFGLLSLGNLLNIIGICNLLGGIAAPILFILGGIQNKNRKSYGTE
ncbi:MAG TPA: hypothetical protein IAB61_13130 [Candidatus Merdisoma merdipullorum]|nr:hypothetical protein [Candidatus Merdisoma merdipullorum]